MGEEREGESVMEGVEDPQRRWRDETGYSFVADGARNVSPLGLRPVGVMGVASEGSVSDSLNS